MNVCKHCGGEIREDGAYIGFLVSGDWYHKTCIEYMQFLREQNADNRKHKGS